MNDGLVISAASCGSLESAGRSVEAADVDSLAAALSHTLRLAVAHETEPGIGAKVNKVILGLG